MKRILFLSCCVILAAHLCAGLVSAGVIYNNGDPDLSNAYMSDLGFIALQMETGDDFSLSTNVILRDVHWYGVYGWGNGTEPAQDDFTIRIFNVVGGVPGTTPFYEEHIGDVGRVDTGNTIGNYRLFAYSTLLTDTTLNAGDYFLSIVNNTSEPSYPDYWYWAFSSPTGNAHFRSIFTRNHFGDGRWVPMGGEASFNLTGEPVPEPGTLLMLGTGLAGFAGYGIRLKRRKRA